jgi:hypothetical protein
MFYPTDEHIDCTDNFSKLLLSVDSLAGKKAEYKWIIIYLFMFLQSLFIVALSHSNKYSIIKRCHSKTKNNKTYTFEMDHSIETMSKLFTIKYENNSTIIRIAPFFGTEESFHELTKTLKNQNINIPEDQIKASYKQIIKLLPISELFKKIEKIVTINEEIEQSFKDLIKLRNDFIHFSPKTWSIEINLIKTVALHCAQLSLLLIKSDCIREYELDKNEMIKGLNKIIKGFGQSV